MNYLLLQTFLLLLASYFLGAFLACLVKRAVLGSRVEISEGDMVPVGIEVPVRPPLVVPPQPVRGFAPVSPPIAPRAIDPVQPKIDVLRRPEPRPVPTVLDPSRFERALVGPDPNEGIPRRAIVEIRPSVLKPVTGMYVPRPPEPPPPPPEPEVELLPEELPPDDIDLRDNEPLLPPEEVAPQKPERIGGLAARLRDATTAAAAGAVAAAKAAAAASVMMPSVFSSRGSSVETEPVSEPEPEAEPAFEPELEPAPEPEPIAEPEPEIVAEATPPAPAYTPLPPREASAPPVAVTQPAPVVERRPEPKPEIKAPPVAHPPIEGGDDFQRIRAIDADLEQKLKAGGVNYFEDIAQWTSADVKRIGQELEIPGRIDREQWVEQAQILAKGGETYYSRNRKSALKSGLPAAPSANTTSSDRQPKSGGADAASPGSGHGGQQSDLSGVDAASQGRSVAEMAAAAAAAIAAASASVTRGLKPIEPISPLSKVDPKISIPAKITDAIRQNGAPSETVLAEESEQPAVAEEDAKDDLKRIRGIGVLIEKRLNALGIGRYEQIANWTSGDIDRVSRSLEFKGRIERENWVEQARILASGGQTEFSRRVDRGEVDTSRDT